MLRHLPLCMLLIAVFAAGAVVAQDTLTLTYTPEAAQKWPEKLQGNLLDIVMQGQSLGVGGFVSADVTVEVLKLNAEAKTADVQYTLSNVDATLNGEASNPKAPQPLLLHVNQQGLMTSDKLDTPGTIDFIETGGIPVQIVGVLAHTVRFSDKPVAIDEEWTCEDTYVFPGLGEVPINSRWKLAARDGDVVTLGSTSVTVLPNFTTPNPMAPGTDMNIVGARATVTAMKQEYDTKLSRVLKAEGTVKIDAKVDMQGMQMPVVLTVKFTLEPGKEAVEPPK